ncbi:hypothetical protein KDL01_10020 [Actinospica durhamensis]|uniref:Uncharacterized protein n=1 Tax=Actinospica durhamensis TaxID=1508375 RepID=A0A941ENA5_9ACTN|nr:hypothetical protein [Actinospica durhamensis]MBR7833602.1 hypothetical protein [Actinospica durhamensis]
MNLTVIRAPLHKRIMTVGAVTLEAASAVGKVTAGHANAGGIVAAGLFTALAASVGVRLSMVAISPAGPGCADRRTPRHEAAVPATSRSRPYATHGEVSILKG